MSKATILIVEDEAIIASDLASRLRRCDYDVVGMTARGEEAVDLARARRPDLVLMDIKLAGAMDGVTAAELIRQQCDLPVIYLTAHSDHATLQRAKLTQPFGYILKPFEERELETHIEMALYKHQADRKLREQREWLRITLTSIGDAVIATDTTSRITFLNPVAESLTGWKEADAIGQSIASVFRIINEETREPAEDVVERVLREGHVVGLGNHTALITRDGREIPIEDSAAPITDAAGKVSGVVLVFHDIAEKRRGEAALRRYELLAAHSRDIILFIRRDDGRILDSNAAAAAVYGHSREEFLALTVQDLRAPDTRSLTAEQTAQADAQGILFETVHRRKDGRTFPVEVSSRGATIDGTRTLISVIRDTTERKRADEERQSLARFPSENPHPVLRLDADGRILHANAASLALLRQWGRSVGSRAPAPWPDTVRNALVNRASTTVQLGCEDRVYAVFVVPVPSAAYVNLYASDITERERVAEELARQREWLQVTLTSIGDAVIATDTDGRVTFLNPLAEALTVWQHEEAVGQPIQSVFRIVNEVTGEPAENIVADVLRLGAAITLANHTALVTRDGRMVPVEDSAAPIKDSNGRMVGAVVVFHDVTEKRHAEAAIRKAKEEWERTFDCVPDLITVLDDQHRVLRVNRAMAQRLGQNATQCIGTFCYQCVHGTDAPPAFCPHSRSLQDGRTHAAEVHEERLGGDFLVTTTPLLDEHEVFFGTVHVARDITDRVRAEQALRESEERYRRLVELAPDAVLVHQDGQIVYANAAAVRLYGAESFEQLRGKDILELVHLDEREAVRARVQLVQDGGIAPLHAFRHVRLDGQEVPVESIAAPADWQRKRAVQVIIRDITERRWAELALRQSREDLNRAQAVAHTGSWRLDTCRNELQWSDETYRIFGIPQGTPLTYEIFLGTIHPEDRKYVDEKWTAALQGAPYDIEHRIVVGDTVKWVRERAELEFDKDGALLGGFGTVQDITARKQAEEALRQAKDELEWRVRERTAELSKAIGTLQRQAGQLRSLAAELTLAEQRERRRLAEVLHDGLQQLLVAARVRAHMLGRSSDPGVQRGSHELVALLEEALTEARTLTGELSPPALQKGGLLPTLEWLTRWMGEKHHLTVRLKPPATPLPVLGEDVSILLYQAVRELLLNAVKYAQVSAADVTLRVSDETLTLTVADTGVGFDPARLRVLGGTEGGFGLLGIRERLELLGGHLAIASHPGRGSRFTLVAPLRPDAGEEPVIRPQETPRPEPTPALARPAGRRTRVLVVDDHALVRRGFATLLAGEPDLDVVGEAADGIMAIALARQLVPDVILMDVSMPVLNGIEATRAIHGELPTVRIIGLSVFDDPDQPDAMRAAGAVAYVRKNDPPEALLAAIRGGSTV